MPEVSDKERLAKLETSMIAVLMSIERRTSFESEVLSKLAVISSKMDDYKDYQRTCEAERKAHEVRISDLENSRKTVAIIAGGIGGVAAFIVSIAALYVKR
jgi:hypothetical protein